ncbi:hypothetical protein [Filimonas effusa]|uniref:Uncharacterized protein n=1 Tax=Filimonas effusa TaxID=2508721 RepID=A0A4Q1DBU6_9BACT|nr:hypothetical protein [Filimonas effusa]RXK86941.1 hypothetical protein ESB13_09190 [Filimonas effusa]
MTNRINNKEPAPIEAKQWLVILDELRQVNILLKNRLVHALKQDVSRNFIETAEYYHQKFIDKDQLIRLLRHDITSLLEEHIDAQDDSAPWLSRFFTLEKDMQRIISEFSGMKAAFETYLSEKQDVRATGS